MPANPYQPKSVQLGETTVSSGSYFEDGLRMGPDFTNVPNPTTATFPPTSPGAANFQSYVDSSAFAGKGVPIAPYVMYSLAPFPGFEWLTLILNQTHPETYYDIAKIPAGSPAGTNVPITLGGAAARLPNQGAAWLVSDPNQGGPYLQLDVPRALSIQVYGGDLTSPITITANGCDTNLQLMTASYGEFSAGNELQDAGIYSYASSLAQNQPVVLRQTNKAFYRLFNLSYTCTSAINHDVLIGTSLMFGFPYFFSQNWTPLISFYAGIQQQIAINVNQASVGNAYPLGLWPGIAAPGVPPSNLPATTVSGKGSPSTDGFSLDVRGTFCPALYSAQGYNFLEPLPMSIGYLAIGGNTALNVNASTGQNNYLYGLQENLSFSQTYIAEEQSIGFPQYVAS